MKHIIHFPLLTLLLVATLAAEAQPSSIQVAVTYNKTSMLVLPSAIIDADRGSDQISIRIAKKAPTVLKVKASTPGIDTTNLTIYTADGRMYMTTIYYSPKVVDTPYTFESLQNGIAITPKRDAKPSLTQQQVKDLAATLASKQPLYKHPSSSALKIKLSLGNIWLADNTLFLQLVIRNRSAIPYDIAMCKYYQRDNTHGKRSSVSEKELFPLHEQLPPAGRIASGGEGRIIVAFEKFTLSEQKHLAVDLFENNGDRHPSLKIKGEKLLHITLP